MNRLNPRNVEKLYIGCCGFAISQKLYFDTFATIEIQQTFYQPPESSTLKRWKQLAPLDFSFTIKAWQLITHPPSSLTYRRLKRLPHGGKLEECGFFKLTPTTQAAWHTTLTAASILKADVILLQSPKSFTPTEENISQFKEFICFAKGQLMSLEWDKLPYIAWEPRGKWNYAIVQELCNQFGLLHAVDPFVNPPLIPPPVYLRLHGGEHYAHQYSDKELAHLITMLHKWKKGWCLFNNKTMAQDAKRLMALLQHS